MKRKPRFDAGPRQAGIALIAVLLLLVFILTIVGGLFYRHQIHIQKASRAFVGEQALLLLMSAESWARSVLEEDARNSATDHPGETWAQRLPVLPIEGGRISGCLVDLQGLFNINSLAWYTNKSWDDELKDRDNPDRTTRRRLMANVLEQLEMENSDARIAALVDWLDADAWLVSPDSAEDNEYLLRDPPYRAANHVLTELSELSLVQGFGPADVAKLRPWVNVVNEENEEDAVKINVNTAPAFVLTALSPYIREQQAEALMGLRPFENEAGFYTELAGVTGTRYQTLMEAIPDEFVGVASNYFALQARVELAGIRMDYRSIIRRDGGNGAWVLSRTIRHIPPVAKVEGKAPNSYADCSVREEEPETT